MDIVFKKIGIKCAYLRFLMYKFSFCETLNKSIYAKANFGYLSILILITYSLICTKNTIISHRASK